METVNVGAKDFKKIVVLGEGGYGKVILVRKMGGCDHGRLYALKEMRKTTNMKRMGYFLNERHVLERVRGQPFLATLHYAFETVTDLNVVLDYANGGDMFTQMSLRGSFSEDHVKFYVGEIVLALQHLHQLKIVHGDIKPDNILLDSSGHVVLADFGLSKFVTCKKIKNCDLCGTTWYLAPEVIQCNQGEIIGYPVDWWAVGVVTYELLTGRSPFASRRNENTREEVFRRILRNKPLYPSKMSFEAREFVKSLLNTDPNKRLGTKGVGEVKKHSFFKGLSWTDLSQKKVPAPFVPCIERDLGDFAQECTNMALEEPAEVTSFRCIRDSDNLCSLTHSNPKLFKGFPYVGPAIHVTKSPNSNLLDAGMIEPPSATVKASLVPSRYNFNTCRSEQCLRSAAWQQVTPCCSSHSMTTTNLTVSARALSRVSCHAHSRGDEKAAEVQSAVCEPTNELHDDDHTRDYHNNMAGVEVSSKRRRQKKRSIRNIFTLPRAVFGCIKR